MHLLHVAEVDSTSDHLRRLANTGEATPWTVVLADRQTAGHGQHGRTWASTAKGLYMSLLLPPEVVSPVLTLIAGVAAVTACQAVSGATHLGLKWVNDLVWLAPVAQPSPLPPAAFTPGALSSNAGRRGRKIGGILAEVAHRRFAIVGIGINLEPVDVPDAASLAEAAGRAIDRLELVEAIVRELEAGLASWREAGAGPAIAAWRARSVTLGRDVRVETGGRVLLGFAQDVDEEGHLILRLPDGRTETVVSGTVRLADGSYA